MADTQHCSEGRFTASGISSNIFAPPQQNYSLSLVTMRVPLVDALALECLSGLDESINEANLVGKWLKGTYEQRRNASEYFAEYFQQVMRTSSVTLTLPSEVASKEAPSIAARRFPFVTHYDLLTSPVEGTFFDPDDFVDR